MIEGWCGNEYLVLFDEDDVAKITLRYEIGAYLPGYTIVGLRGWDDFLLRDHNGRLFTVPTVPADPKYLAPFASNIDIGSIKTDDRYMGKIKWYVKPVVFGGDAKSTENIAWVNLDQHIEAVKWWNQTYRKVSQKDTNRR
jgi:hypothetical protein